MNTAVLRMPRLGETMEEGKLVSWVVGPGERFNRGDPILEVETDKTVVEFPALGPGVLAEVLAEIGQTVTVGDPIARIDLEDGHDWIGDTGKEPTLDETAPTDRAVVTLPMPRLGETMEEGVLVAWLVESNATFRRGDPLIEIETDKTVAEYPALVDGVFLEALVAPGETVAVGTPIARLDVDAKDRASFDSPASGTAAGSANISGFVATAQTAQPGPEERQGRPRATPLARRLARSSGIDLDSVVGTGRRGRIERRDIEALQARDREHSAGGQGIVWVEKGPSDAIPIFFLHGLGDDHNAWAAVTSVLAKAGRRTMAIDLPAHGQTQIEVDDALGLAELVEPLFADIATTKPVHIVAHSLGAIPAVSLASRIPTASLTLIAPVGLGYEIDSEFILGLAEASTVGEVEHLLRRTVEGPLGLSNPVLETIAMELGRGRLRNLARGLIGAHGQAVSIREDLASLAEKLSVHMILGHRDKIIDWQECVDVSSRIAVHHFALAGHVPHRESFTEVASILEEITG